MTDDMVMLALRNWLFRLKRGHTIPHAELERGISDALTALSSPATRDGFRDLVRAMIDVDGGEGSKCYHARKYHDARLAVLDALKRPAIKLTFKRNDGTTSPTRGDVEDRRKSAHGGGIRFGHRVVAYQRIGDHIWSTKEGMYGRRSGDRARWTAQPAPQPETKCDLCDDTGVVVDYETGLGGQCPHTWRSRPAHEIMAAAPASINSVAMTTPAPQAQPGLLDELYRGGRVAYGNDAKMYDVYRVAEATSARLDELDRRLAAMEVK